MLASLIDEGKTHDEIIQAFIAKYGSEEMLGAPVDKGFNRLAWLLPYLFGASGAAMWTIWRRLSKIDADIHALETRRRGGSAR